MAISRALPGTYVAHLTYELPENTDQGRFRAALEKVVDANPILRTRIILSGSKGPVQVVRKRDFTYRASDSFDEAERKNTAARMTYGTPLSLFRFSRLSDSRSTFTWTAHHAIYDGWSVSFILDQIKAHYLGQTIPSIIPYIHFVRWIRATDNAKAEAFWQAQLADDSAQSFPQLPHEGYQPRTNSRALQSMHLDRSGGRQYEAPMIMRAAWALLTSRYLQSKSVLLGSISSGRGDTLRGVRSIAGPTISTFPVRVVVEEQATVAEFLQRMRQQATDIEPYEHWGLHRIAKMSDSGKAASSFRSLLVTQRGKPVNADFSAQFFRPLSETAAGFHAYPLVLECRLNEGTTEVDLDAQYDNAVLSEWEMTRLLQQFAHVVRQLAHAGPETKIDDIDTFSPEDDTIVQQWDNSQKVEAVESCVHDLIQQQTRTRPEAAAVDAWDGKLTYSELDALSSRLATRLVDIGVKPQTMVPICTDRSLWTVVCMLAVLKTGAVFVPLDSAVPIGRLEQVLQATQAEVVLTCSDARSDLAGIAVHIFNVSAVMATTPSSTTASANVVTTPADTAYIMFTSGSTGRPKGVVMTHMSVCSSVTAHGKAMKFNADTRALHFASLGFDASIAEILTTLVHGGCVCIPDEEQRLSDVTKAINQYQVNWAFFTPSVISLIQPHQVPCLETLVLGGEAVKKDNIEMWADHVDLINGYGPTEVCVFCVSTPLQRENADSHGIGTGLGSKTWVASLSNTNQLAPLGAVGELWIESPQLAVGYFDNEDATSSAFVTDPPFLKAGHQRRLYRTGDIVRYNQNGTLRYMGRRDTQIKVRGQRLELGEIEHQLCTSERVETGVVLFPKHGPLAGKVTAVISLSGDGGQDINSNQVNGHNEKEEASDVSAVTKEEIQLLRGTQAAAARLQAPRIRQLLADVLPSFMIPAAWVFVETIPLTSSGKLDRVCVGTWVEEMADNDAVDTVLDASADAEGQAADAMTRTEEALQLVCSEVLGVPTAKISMARSFLNQGGDSITAMQLASRCRAKGMRVTVPNILHSSTLSQLAIHVGVLGQSKVPRSETIDEPFALSPIQELYQGLDKTFSTRFNQSFFVRLTRHKSVQDVAHALEALVSHHSMLRARFTADESGQWQQIVTAELEKSFEFNVHSVPQAAAADRYLASTIAKTQSRINPKTGPVFAVDMFEFEADNEASEKSGTQVLFLVAHHLIIDLVSWRIILEQLEELLESGKLSAEKPVPFQIWTKLQREYAESQLSPDLALPFKLPAPRLDFWGLDDQRNVWGDIESLSFNMSESATGLLLGDCNTPFNTKPVDLFITALIQSFKEVFPERTVPTVFGEGHGREPWDEDIDLSGTVGWFTTMRPISITTEAGHDEDLITTLCQVKDVRHAVPSNGWAYFASRFLHPDGRDQFGANGSAEILFNYLGRFQQLENKESLIQHEARISAGADTADLGPDTPRMAIIDVSASVEKGEAMLSIAYNKKVRHASRIVDWVQRFEKALQRLAVMLPNRKRDFTISDLPLLKLSTAGLRRLVDDHLPSIGVQSIAEIEDIYPCSPIQEGILVSQTKVAGHYETAFEFEPISRMGVVDASRLAAAWQSVVDRHPMLRTVFIEGLATDSGFAQVVLKKCPGKVIREPVDGQTSLGDDLSSSRRMPQSAHRLVIKETEDGHVRCKLEINHALIDGASLPILFNDLTQAYLGSLSSDSGPLYRDYVAYLSQHAGDASMGYWSEHLSGLEPCHFPRLADSAHAEAQLRTTELAIGDIASEMNAFCAANDVTVSNVIYATWAVLLRAYTGSEDVAFGYLTSGRDVPVQGAEAIIGPFINILTSRLPVQSGVPMREVVEASKEAYLQGLPHQSCSLARVQHDLGLSGQTLFNTLVSVQTQLATGDPEEPDLYFRSIGGHDPTEVSSPSAP